MHRGFAEVERKISRKYAVTVLQGAL